MSLRVQGGSLEAISHQLKQLPASFRRELHQQLAVEAVTQVQLGFEEGRDPDGREWAPLKRPRRRDRGGRAGRPLRDTNRLMNSYAARATTNGFILRTAVKYAPYPQHGTRHMVARPMVPERDLGPIWSAAFDAVGEQWMRARAKELR